MLITAIFNAPVNLENVSNLIRSEEGRGKGAIVDRTVFIISEKSVDHWLGRLEFVTGQKRIIVTASNQIAVAHPDETLRDWLLKAV